MSNKSEDDRVHKLESANYELRLGLKECREQLERVERMLERSEQDNQPRS